MQVIVEIENTSTADLYLSSGSYDLEDADGMIYILLILKDASGTPIGQIFTIITEDLAAGDTIGFEASGMILPDDVTTDAVSSYTVFAYPMQMQF